MFGNKGVLNGALVKAGILDSPSSAFLYNSVAMTIALVSMYIVFIVGPVYFGLSRIDADTLAASRMSGASPWATFWKVELPLAKPGIVAGSFFATVFLLGDFATEQIVGGATNPMLAGLSLRYAETLQWPMAAAVSAALLVVAWCSSGCSAGSTTCGRRSEPWRCRPEDSGSSRSSAWGSSCWC